MVLDYFPQFAHIYFQYSSILCYIGTCLDFNVFIFKTVKESKELRVMFDNTCTFKKFINRSLSWIYMHLVLFLHRSIYGISCTQHNAS